MSSTGINNDDVDDDFCDEYASVDNDKRFISLAIAGTVLCTQYYMNYLMKQETRTSRVSGWKWVQETLTTPGESYKMFRMESHVLLRLAELLVDRYGLQSTRSMRAEEALAMFVWTCAHHQSNRNVQNRFKHSGETISRKFGEVLDSLVRLSADIVKAPDFEFKDVPNKIRNDNRYWPHFKNCIGAIDGTHIEAVVPIEDQIPYIGRKGYPTQNVMAVCNFDMLFTFFVAGWPGSAHDNRIFSRTLVKYNSLFPHPPEGKYYLVDAGYPNTKGYLAPYKGERYHIPDFRRRSRAEGHHEVFNHIHSSLRNVIERTFAVWKNRWRILLHMPSYPLDKQKKLVAATMALHNYIRKYAIQDEEFDRCDKDPSYMPDIEEDCNENSLEGDTHIEVGIEGERSMNRLRDQIAMSLMSARQL